MALFNAPMQFKLTSTTTNYDVFADPKVAAELLSRYGYTSAIIASNKIKMKIIMLFDTAATVIVNGREYNAPDFYDTMGYVIIQSLKIKETGINFLLQLAVEGD